MVAGVVASLSLLGQARGAFLESGGLVVIEAEHFQSTTSASGHLWVPTNNAAGFVGDAAMAAVPNSGTTISANVPATSPALNYQVQFTDAGNYKFWIRGWAASGSDDSIYVGVDGVAVSMTYGTAGAWIWKSVPVTITTAGPHQVSVWMREDGAYVDRLLLSTNQTFTPTGNGPAESPAANGSPSDVPPTVQITAPADGSSFTLNTPVPVSVNASDTDGTVASVDYYLNGVLATRQTTAPFGFTWTPAQGSYQIRAVATDDQGATSSSSSIVNVAITPIPGTFFEANNLVVMEAEHFYVNSPASAHAWVPTNNVAGYTGDSAMAAMPNSGTNFSSTTGSPRLGYLVQLTNAGAAKLWIRGWAATSADNTAYLGVDSGKSASVTYSQTGAWVWQSVAVTIASPGLHQVYLWMRKDGAYADRLILSLDSTFTPTGNGPAESAQASGTISPPVANFVAGVTAGAAPLTVVFTNQSTGATSYAWDFGDGNVSTLPSPSNTYINAGTYSVTLTAVGPGGTNVLTVPNYITVGPALPPVANFTAGVTSGPAPLPVFFTNLSTGALSYAWDFGDGNSSTLASPSNLYTNARTYSVALTASGPGGVRSLTQANYIVVGPPLPPVAGFAAGPTNGVAPLTVVFTNLSTGATSYAWDFGDGNSSTSVNPTNTYTNAGTYTVALAVSGPGGSSTLTQANYITVSTVPPPVVASFAAGPTSGIAPVTVVFTNLSTGATAYTWDFGDGNSSALANPVNTYTNPGTYSVTLKAVGLGGTNILTLSNYVTAANPPSAVFGTFVESSNMVIFEAEHYQTSTSASGHAWVPTNDVAGFTGTSAMKAMPNSGTTFSSISGSPMLGYSVLLTNTGPAKLWFRGWAASGSDDSVYLGVDGQGTSVSFGTTGAWFWKSVAVTITNTGLHQVNVWMREDGAYVDRLILSLDSSFTPTGNGPPEIDLGVQLTSPAPGFTTLAGTLVPLTAAVANAGASAVGVLYYVDGALTGAATTPPFTFNWTPPAGGHQLLALATNSLGSVALSLAVSVTITSPPPMTVQVTSPASGFSALAGTLVPVTAAIANAGSSTVGVEYFVNGALTGAATTPPFTFNWTPSAGSYQLLALATNSLGNYATSAPVSVTITSPPPMTVQITSPASGFTTVQYTTIPVSAGVANAGTSAVSVLFFVNGAYAAVATNAPFTFNWTPLPPSTYQLSAVATNNLGNSATSAPVSVTITSLPPLAVQITSPASGANVPAGLTVPVSAQVLNAGNSLVGVQFFVNGTLAFTDTKSPFTFNYAPAVGPSAIVAVATNDLGSFATSAPVSLIATSPPAAQYRYASSSSTIYVTNGGYATLSQIHAALPKAPLVLTDAVNSVWFLGANIVVTNGSTLLLHGTAQGGDVNQLLMKSENSSAAGSYVSIDAAYGTIDINGVKIASTNSVAQGPDTEFLTYQRAFIRARSLAPNQQSTLNVFNSDIGFLGYNNPQGYGLTWGAVSSPPGVTVFGAVSQSLIHDCQLGVSTWSAFNVSWGENEIATNFIYGFISTNATQQAVLAANNVHDDQFGASLRYASSTHTLYVEGGGVASLLYITNVLPSASQVLTNTDPVNHVWFLSANIVVDQGSTLLLHGTAQGGDVDQLLMKSDNSSTTGSYVSIIADWGTIDINGVKVTSWDEVANGPDTEYLAYQRAYISALSRLGPPIQQSTLNVLNSDIGFLGYENSAAYGLTWNVVSSPPGLTVFGTVSNSFIHNCQLGVNTWSAGIDNVTWVGNEIATNVLYGFNSTDPGQQAVLATNNVHDNILGASLRYASSTSTIYVEGGGVASLSDIQSALPSAPLVLTDAVNHVWFLGANVVVDQGSTLLLHGTAKGGDVNELRLKSDNSSAAGSYVSIIADWGTIDINGVKVTAWDEAASGPDTEYSTYQRAYISVLSRLGPPIQQSTLNVLNSDIGFLGYNNNAAYGLTWNAVSSPPGVTVFGTVSNSFIHNCQLGVNTWSVGIDNVTWVGNEIATNVFFGFNSTDPGQQAVLATNNVHDNILGVSLRYASSTRTIYVEAGGTASLSDIHSALPSAPLVLTDAVNHVWNLRANIVVDQGSTLLLHGTAAGGDVNELRLQSDNSSAAGSYVSIIADSGIIDINGVKVTSWDDTANGPDTEYSTYQRAYISVLSRLGPPIQQSTLNVLNSDIGYLGYNNNAAYGLTWDAVSSPPGVTVFGTVSNSFIHNCQLGVDTWSVGIDNVTWVGNEIATNVFYGFNPSDPGQQAVLATNNVHDNILGVSLRYATSTRTIYVEAGGVATLTDIRNALPAAPLVLTDAVNHVWILRANIVVDQGSTLLLHGTAVGGDVNELRLQSDNSSAANSYVSITADWGTIDINGVKVTSWDDAANGPDTEYLNYQRAYISVLSRLGPPIQQSTLNVLNSDIGYLGYNTTTGYGLTWDVVSSPPGVSIFGTVSNSFIHDCQLDVLTWSTNTYNVYWISNQIAFNMLYDYDDSDPGQKAVLANNNVHDNTFGVTFRWSGSNHRIYVIGPGTVTLSNILPHVPPEAHLTNDPVNAVWYLGSDLYVINGARLKLYGPAIGGDVAELRLKSDTTPDPNGFNFVELRSDWGYLDIRNTKITSWDSNVNGPTTITNYGRAFIHARSTLDVDGVTAHESRMDVLNSEICYLGTHNAEAYGLTWKLVDTTVTNIPPGSTNSLNELVKVYGDLVNSHIHHNFFGMYSYGLVGAHIATNEVDHNIAYGLDPHNWSDNLVIENNNVHDNGWHGIIASKFCVNGIMRNNVSWHNGLDPISPHGNGLMLHRSCNGWVVENNLSYDNPDSGIAIFACANTLIRHNTCLTNDHAGIRLSVGAANNWIEANEFGYLPQYGFYLFQGNDDPELEPGETNVFLTGRCYLNTFTNNYVHDYAAQAIRLVDSDTNTFTGNLFIGSNTAFTFQEGTNNIMINNAVPADTFVELDGSNTNSCSTTFKDQPVLALQVDIYSTATFADDSGAIFDFGANAVATTAKTTATGSSVSVTSDDVGLGENTVVTRNFYAATTSGSVQITPTTWNVGGDHSKAWTAKASSTSLSVQYIVGDLQPAASYQVAQGVTPLATLVANPQGYITFTASPGTKSLLTYSVTQQP